VLYAAPQLRILVVLALTLLGGLTVREWRAGFPDAAERFERFDREEPAGPPVPETETAAPSTAATGPVPAAPSPTGVSGLAAPPVPAPRPPPEPVDVNRADADQLARLPGVGAALARRIVEEREQRGRFAAPEELRYVLGMGPKKLAAIRRFITVSD
jgi:competence ComEA-like helix-hairpin-helix protein